MSKVKTVIAHQVKDIYEYKIIKKKSLTCIASTVYTSTNSVSKRSHPKICKNQYPEYNISGKIQRFKKRHEITLY